MWCIEARAKIDIPLGENTIKAGQTITLTKGNPEKYALWAGDSIWGLDEGYVGETIRIVSDK